MALFDVSDHNSERDRAESASAGGTTQLALCVLMYGARELARIPLTVAKLPIIGVSRALLASERLRRGYEDLAGWGLEVLGSVRGGPAVGDQPTGDQPTGDHPTGDQPTSDRAGAPAPPTASTPPAAGARTPPGRTPGSRSAPTTGRTSATRPTSRPTPATRPTPTTRPAPARAPRPAPPAPPERPATSRPEAGTEARTGSTPAVPTAAPTLAPTPPAAPAADVVSRAAEAAEAAASRPPAQIDRDDLPLPDFDHLTVGSLRGRLRRLNLSELRVLRAYEQEHAGRLPILTMLENRIAKLQAEGG